MMTYLDWLKQQIIIREWESAIIRSKQSILRSARSNLLRDRRGQRGNLRLLLCAKWDSMFVKPCMRIKCLVIMSHGYIEHGCAGPVCCA